MRLDSETRRVDGVTLVAARVTNPATDPRRVRIANRLDGPVWPPRTGGRPAPGWDDGGYEGVLAPGETRALGYATPGPAADPPAVVAWTERAPAGERADGASAGELVARLGDPRPPRDAVPTPDATAVPPAVRSWLDAVAARTGGDGLRPGDRRTLAAVRDEVAALLEDA